MTQMLGTVTQHRELFCSSSRAEGQPLTTTPEISSTERAAAKPRCDRKRGGNDHGWKSWLHCLYKTRPFQATGPLTTKHWPLPSASSQAAPYRRQKHPSKPKVLLWGDKRMLSWSALSDSFMTPSKHKVAKPLRNGHRTWHVWQRTLQHWATPTVVRKPASQGLSSKPILLKLMVHPRISTPLRLAPFTPDEHLKSTTPMQTKHLYKLLQTHNLLKLVSCRHGKLLWSIHFCLCSQLLDGSRVQTPSWRSGIRFLRLSSRRPPNLPRATKPMKS